MFVQFVSLGAWIWKPIEYHKRETAFVILGNMVLFVREISFEGKITQHYISEKKGRTLKKLLNQ